MSARRAGVVVALLTIVARLAAGTTNDPATAQAEGRDLARQLCELRPTENFTNASTLIIRPAKGRKVELPLRTVTLVTTTNWVAVYETMPGANALDGQRLTVTHNGFSPNTYTLANLRTNGTVDLTSSPQRDVTMTPFAESDFWVADLGLEFFHWPEQRLWRKELKKGQSCSVLESRPSGPVTNGYSRVVSWIDIDTGGIVEAAAYDAKGKLLKEFEVKEAEKVDGQWKVSEIQIRNAHTGSRTTLKFNFSKP